MATNSSFLKRFESSLPKAEAEILRKIEAGLLKPYELERHVSGEQAMRIRAAFAAKLSGVALSAIPSHSLTPDSVRGSIENMIGAVQIPLGIAGPLAIRGRFYKGKALIPLATTEGALVASVNRGCAALNRGRGVNARLVRAAQTRAPLFEAEDADAALRLAALAKSHFPELKKAAERESRFLTLIAVHPYVVGNLVWLRVLADTGDAMGMNMISIAAQNMAAYLEKKARGVRYLSVSGNLCVDKKPSALTLLEGRGRHVIAEATLREEDVREVLKTTPAEMQKLNTYKSMLGSGLAGSPGMNSHFANIVAALYLATGQDMAHVVEGSHGTALMEAREGGLRVSATLPALQLGTVGGGTKLPAAQESMRLMGIRLSPKPGNSANQLAEVVASAVLAGEVSLLAAHAAKHLVDAHRRLNR